MTPGEFDVVAEYDENYIYELVNGVVVVHPIPGAVERGPNELLGYYLLDYQKRHPQGAALDGTFPQSYVFTRASRRLADRLIWTGLRGPPRIRRDVPSITVEFVSAGRRNAQRDYVDKRGDYLAISIPEYGIIDRFRRTLTVIRLARKKVTELIVKEHETYESPQLPGFVLHLGQILEAADQGAWQDRE